MSLLTILAFPDPRLRTKAVPVTQVDAALNTLIDDMIETMYAANGIGLAATQVNVHQRLVVIDVSEAHDEPRAFINPEIIAREGVEVTEEGCLSVPGAYEEVERAERVTVKALDRTGKEFTTVHGSDFIVIPCYGGRGNETTGVHRTCASPGAGQDGVCTEGGGASICLDAAVRQREADI